MRVVTSWGPPPDYRCGILHQGRQGRRNRVGELAEGGTESLAVGDAGREGEGSQEREGVGGGESSQRKDPVGVGQVVVAGAAVVVNGNAGFGEQGKVPAESAEVAPAGIGKGKAVELLSSALRK